MPYANATVTRINASKADSLYSTSVNKLQDKLYNELCQLFAAETDLAENISAAFEVARRFDSFHIFRLVFIGRFRGLNDSKFMDDCRTIGIDPYGFTLVATDNGHMNAIRACSAYFTLKGKTH